MATRPETAIERLKSYYNGNPQTEDNPGGMDNDGHEENFVPALQDVAAAGKQMATQVLMVGNFLSVENGWTLETRTVSRVDATRFIVAGVSSGEDLTSLYSVGRALSVIQTASGFAAVASSSYDPESNLTTVAVAVLDGQQCVTELDDGLAQIFLGQDPNNAPAVSSTGSDLYIFANYTTLGGA